MKLINLEVEADLEVTMDGVLDYCMWPNLSYVPFFIEEDEETKVMTIEDILEDLDELELMEHIEEYVIEDMESKCKSECDIEITYIRLVSAHEDGNISINRYF